MCATTNQAGHPTNDVPEIPTDTDDTNDTEEEEDDDESTGSDDFTLRAKWQMDGARTLDEAIDKLQGFIDFIAALRDEGWRLRRPIDDDYGFLTHDKLNADGTPFVSELFSRG